MLLENALVGVLLAVFVPLFGVVAELEYQFIKANKTAVQSWSCHGNTTTALTCTAVA